MSDSEATILRKELVKTVHRADKLEREIAEVRGENAELRRRIDQLTKARAKDAAEWQARLALYESPNMPTSKPSLFNADRDKFRSSRGEKPRGNPGEKAAQRPDAGAGKQPDGDPGGQGETSGDPGRTSGGQGEAGKKARRGPPVGHKGASHCNKPAKTVEYPAERCPRCGRTDLNQLAPVRKQVADFDGDCRTVTVATAVIGRAACKCGAKIRAPDPFADGTFLGPVALGLVAELHDLACTDRDIARLFEGFFRFRMSPNAVWNARKALSRRLDAQIESIKREFLRWLWVLMDETGFKTGGRTGYVWVAAVPGAVFVWFAPGRTDAVLHEHFAWLAGRAVVCDGYGAYSTKIGGKKLFRGKQRCWRHLLSLMEALAVAERKQRKEAGEEGPGPRELRYDQFLEMYRGIRHLKTLAPFTTMNLARLAWKLASGYGEQGEEGRVRGHVMRAIPDMFTFAAFPGMPPHNNGAEIEIRDAVVGQRNVRHKLVTAEGREVFSRMVTFSRTCRKRGMFPCRAVVDLLRDPGWDVIDPERAGAEPAGPEWSALSGPVLRAAAAA